MNLELKPELQRFIDDQVNEGRFASRAEVVEAAVARLMLDPQSDSLGYSTVSASTSSCCMIESGGFAASANDAISPAGRNFVLIH